MKKNKTYTKKQAGTIIDKSMIAFGLSYEMKTDTRIMKSIIKEFKLDDFKTKNKRMDKFFKDVLSKPQKLQPMFDNIRKGIVSKHPAVVEFAELALKKRWFCQSEHIIKSIHIIYILEALTATMCNSHKFFIETQDHYKTKERKCGVDTVNMFSTFMHTVKIAHTLFGTIKLLLVDPTMIFFRTQRGLAKSHMNSVEAKKLLRDKKINYIEYKLLSPIHKNGLEQINELIRLNIYEAGITEYKSGLKTNAICAHELSEDIKCNPPQSIFKEKSVIPENNTDPFYKSIAEKNNLFPVFEFSQKWVSLYITWNMAFILSNLDNLDLLFPKLLIPSVINAETSNCAGARIISLWLSINHFLFRSFDERVVLGPRNKIEMAQAWAKINKKYAFDLAKREMHEDSRELMKSCKRFFSQPLYNLFKLARVFID